MGVVRREEGAEECRVREQLAKYCNLLVGEL
jgi:hypothetical protein